MPGKYQYGMQVDLVTNNTYDEKPWVRQLLGTDQTAGYILLEQALCVRVCQDLQSVLQMLINLHDCCLIAASIAVIWCYQSQDHAYWHTHTLDLNIPEKIVTTFLSWDQL